MRDVSVRERLDAESRARLVAESASRAKTAMLSFIAHEMGNPLNGLLGFAQLMANDRSQPLPEGQARRLEHVLASGRHLQGLMRDVLDVGRFEAGAMSLRIEAVDAAAAVAAAVDAVGALALQADVGVRVGDAPMPLAVLADPKRLHQCLLNLLTNGVKYCRAGSSVSVTLVATGATVRIEVGDNGPGMTEAQCRHLFEPFNRLGREHGSLPGSGLGLVITRQLAGAMGGTLEVASELGAGSRFTLTLPLARAAR